VEGFAREISEKYIDPPHTTDFGIMFLPVESLYAEVLRHPGLFETLQRKYKITVTGPTTLSALLNSLQMGFRTLAVQKRSSEVWSVLGAVKSEFSKFSEQLGKVQKQLNTASGTLDTLRNTRTNQIERRLRSVESLDGIESRKILEFPPDEDEDELKDE
jgi:DNA recombination protein RmuC